MVAPTPHHRNTAPDLPHETTGRPARGARTPARRSAPRRAVAGLSVAALAATALTVSAPSGLANGSSPASEDAQPASLRVLSYNTFLFSKIVYPNLGQDHRAEQIPQADFFPDHDVVVLQEMYSNGPADTLMERAEADFPYQTPVLGRSLDGWDATGGAYSRITVENGGVTVLSKWPINRQEQYVYADACGVDALAKKGLVYVELDVDGTPVHVVGTHNQSEDSLCSDGRPAEIRSEQFQELDAFLAAKDIPADQQVIVAGDFNVDSRSDEYPRMLADGGLADPASRTGHPYSFDTQENSITHDRGGDKPPRDLDYVLQRAGHAAPEGWTNKVYQETSTPWTAPDGKEYTNLSDHYPVTGSAG